MIRDKKVAIDIQARLSGIKKFCQHHPEIEFIYLFGSHGRRKHGPLSDIDLAVYLGNSTSPDSYFQTSADLMGEFSHLLQTNEVDVVILNRAPLSLQYQVVFEGRLLYERRRLQRILFETKVIDLFLDAEPLRATSRSYLKDQIKRGAFVG